MYSKCLKTVALIVGSGPVGITLQLLLSRMKIPSILLEKNVLSKNHPRAHYLSNRSMEIWRQIGHIDKALECVIEPLEYWRYFKYCRHIVDPHINLYAVQDNFKDRYRYNETYFEEYSPSRIANFPQHKLLFFFKSLSLNRSQLYKNNNEFFKKWLDSEYNNVMFKSKIDDSKLQKLLNLEQPISLPTSNELRNFTNYDIKTNIPFIDGGYKFERFLSKDKKIVSRVKDVRNGTEFDIESLFVIGTDGIHSSVANELFGKREINSNVKDTSNLKEVISVHFESKELGECVSSNPAMMYFIFSQCICVLVCQGGTPPEFVVQIPFFPEFEPLEFYNEENCCSLINEAVGTKLNDIKIYKIKKWTVTTDVAKSLVDPETSRIFLAGDAAHLVAPAGGLGMNMGIADTYNLAWRISRTLYSKSLEYKIFDFDKLLDVLFEKGLNEKDNKMLSEYSVERKAIAEYTRGVCLKEVENGSKFAKYLWYNHGNMQSVIDVVSPILPKNSGFLPFIFNSVKSFMKYVYNTPKSMDVIGNFSRELFSKHDGSLGLAFPGSDLAYSYNYGDLKISKSHRHYLPQSYVGLRIPHCYFYSELDSAVYKMSTVDLPSFMQPPVYYCVLVFNRKMIERVLSEIDFNLYYICLWETDVSVGSGLYTTISDQFLSKPNTLINKIGMVTNIKTSVDDEKIDDHFIFTRLNENQDYEYFNAALKYVSKMPQGTVKKVFSSRDVLDNFSKTLLGDVNNMDGIYIVLRPDAHILTLKKLEVDVK